MDDSEATCRPGGSPTAATTDSGRAASGTTGARDYDTEKIDAKRWLVWTTASAVAASIVYFVIVHAVLNSQLDLPHAWVYGAIPVSMVMTFVLSVTVLRREVTLKNVLTLFVTHVVLFLMSGPCLWAAMIFLIFVGIFTGLVPIAG